jgi:hypothetical protein
VKPERDYKKTHAMVMSNDNRVGDTSMRQRQASQPLLLMNM